MSSSVTMNDVARRAGVSQATVSMVLSERRTDVKISEETRLRVLAAVKATGYRPHLGARNMKNRRSHQVGALVQNEPHNCLTHPLTWAFILGINDGLADSGYTMSLVRLTDVAEDGGLQAPVFQGHLLDGMIIVNTIPSQLEEQIEKLVPHCVWLDSNIWRPECCIRRDEVHAARLALENLAKNGYRRVHFLGSWHNMEAHYSSSQRLQGAEEAADDCGITLLKEVVPYTKPIPELPYSEQVDWQTMNQWLQTIDQQDAILGMSIYVAHTILEACAMNGIVPGRDFGVACCDDHLHGAGLDWLHLSRVSFDRYDMGIRAAHMMLHKLQSPEEPCPSLLAQGSWLECGTTGNRQVLQSGAQPLLLNPHFGPRPIVERTDIYQPVSLKADKGCDGSLYTSS